MAYLGQTFYTKDLPIESNVGLKRFYLDKEAIETILLNDIINHLKFLFPNGKIKGNSFYIGDISGVKGDSLVITLSGRYAGKGKDFATGESIDIFDMFANHYNLNIQHEFKALLQRLSEYLGLSQSDIEIQAIKARQEQAKQRQIETEKAALLETIKKQETALKLWNDAICINHPKAQAYLQARGLNISFNNHVLRFIPNCYHSELKQPLPCIIALVRSTKVTPYILNNGKHLIGQNGQPILAYKEIGIERHYLPPEPQTTPEAYKQFFTDRGVSRRKILGSKKGGVIKLNDSYKDKLVLCEGLFDALTLLFHGRELGILSDTETPNVYAFLGTNNLADITIPDRYKEVYLLADNDSAGLNSIELLKNNHSLKGRTDVKIEIFKTNSHKDLNELWLSKLKEKPERCDPNELKNIN